MFVDEFEEGSLFKRRPCQQYLPLEEDVLDTFIYCALQPINHGLSKRLSDYPGYTFFHDAIRGRRKKAKWLCYKEYAKAKLKDSNVSKGDFYIKEEIIFSRLPGFEDLSQKEYQAKMSNEYRKRRVEMLEKRKGKPFLGRDRLIKVQPGSKPINPKKGGARPIVKSSCPKEASRVLKAYRSQCEDQSKASIRYMSGDYSCEYPKGMYRPAGNSVIPPPGNYLELTALA